MSITLIIIWTILSWRFVYLTLINKEEYRKEKEQEIQEHCEFINKYADFINAKQIIAMWLIGLEIILLYIYSYGIVMFINCNRILNNYIWFVPIITILVTLILIRFSFQIVMMLRSLKQFATIGDFMQYVLDIEHLDEQYKWLEALNILAYIASAVASSFTLISLLVK